MKKVCKYQNYVYLYIMQNETKTTYRIIGFTDSVNDCDCCGKTDLKGTYVMADNLENELYFGLVCGARASGQSVSEIKESVKKINENKELSEMVTNATNQFLQNKVLSFINKKKIDLSNFLISNATIVDEFNNTKVFQYGSKCFNIEF